MMDIELKNKVCIIDSSVGITGALKSALLMAEALDDTYDVEFVLPNGSNARLEVENKGYCTYELPIYGLRKKITSILFYLPMLIVTSFKIYSLLKRRSISILILNDFDKPYGLFLRFFGWKGKVYTFVRRRPSSFNKILSRFWIKAALLSSNKIIAVSNVVLNELPNSRKKLRIYNAIKFFGSSNDVNYPDFECIRFLCLGNYMPGKGQMEALNSFHIAYGNNKDIRLHFAGGDLGQEKNLKYKESLIKKISALGLSEVVTFEGYVENVKRVICESHIILNLSKSESFSRVCIESGLFGRPVIATKSGGPQEIINHAESGFLVDVGDVVEIASYIEWFANNRDQVFPMGEAAQKIVNNKFSFYVFKKEIQKLVYYEV